MNILAIDINCFAQCPGTTESSKSMRPGRNIWCLDVVPYRRARAAETQCRRQAPVPEQPAQTLRCTNMRRSSSRKERSRCLRRKELTRSVRVNFTIDAQRTR